MAGAPIRIRDVGHVEDGTEEQRGFAEYKGKPAVVLEIRRQTGTNTVQVVHAIQKRLEILESQLPAGVQIQQCEEPGDLHRKLGEIARGTPGPGQPAGVRDRVAVHPKLADGADQLDRYPHFDHHHFHAYPCHGFHPELDDVVGADAGGRDCDRRRHHCAREHLPVHRREGCSAHAGGDPGDQGDFPCGAGHDHFAGYHLRPHRVHDRLRAAVRQPVRLDHGDVDHGFDAGGVHVDAFAERPPAKADRRQKGEQRRRRARAQARILGPQLRPGLAGCPEPPLGSDPDLHRDVRFHLRGEQVHRPRLDATGRPERAFGEFRAAGRFIGGSHAAIYRRCSQARSRRYRAWLRCCRRA